VCLVFDDFCPGAEVSAATDRAEHPNPQTLRKYGSAGFVISSREGAIEAAPWTVTAFQ
jgi:hypothetical protein